MLRYLATTVVCTICHPATLQYKYTIVLNRNITISLIFGRSNDWARAEPKGARGLHTFKNSPMNSTSRCVDTTVS